MGDREEDSLLLGSLLNSQYLAYGHVINMKDFFVPPASSALGTMTTTEW